MRKSEMKKFLEKYWLLILLTAIAGLVIHQSGAMDEGTDLPLFIIGLAIFGFANSLHTQITK